jgi:nitrite reductase/ring-hydroxylating ferredoxin subunit
MARTPRVVCRSGELAERGRGVRFGVQEGDTERPAFAVRCGDRVYAYLNECAHAGLELDWLPGEFFDSSGLYLICSAHGALYEAQSGRCLGGPCRGGGLVPLPVEERDGLVVFRIEDDWERK